MTANEKFIVEVMNGFQLNRGKGSVYCVKPFTPYKLVAKCIITFFNKHADKRILIIVETYNIRIELLKALDELAPNRNFEVKILTAAYINPKYRYDSDYTIIVGCIKDSKLIGKLSNESKFTMYVITEHISNQNIISNIRKHLPNIEVSVNKDDIQRELIYSPVEEHWYGVELSDDDLEQYNKYTEFINNTIAIFGNLQNIEFAKHGNPKLNISSSEFRHYLAKQNGWNEELDMSIEYNKMVDTNYNPAVLFEKACTFYNITNERRSLLLNNKNKLDKIKEVCDNNVGKRILILSKNGEFAAAITKYLNDSAGNTICGDYHDCIEDMLAVDMYGNPILVKSGVDKGKPKVVKSAAISTNNEKMFNEGIITILSAKVSSNIKLCIKVDVVIFTDGISTDIVEVKNRFCNVTFNVPTISHRMFSSNTIEYRKLIDKNQPANVTIIDQSEKNAIFDEKSGDIIW